MFRLLTCNTPLQNWVAYNNSDSYFALSLKYGQISVMTAHLCSITLPVGQLKGWDHLKTCSLTWLTVDVDHQLRHWWGSGQDPTYILFLWFAQHMESGFPGRERYANTEQIMLYSPDLEVTQHNIGHYSACHWSHNAGSLFERGELGFNLEEYIGMRTKLTCQSSNANPEAWKWGCGKDGENMWERNRETAEKKD